MEGFVGLDTIAVIAITLAALSSLLAAVRGGNPLDWAPRLRLGFWILLDYSLGALGFALLPSLLHDLGVYSWGALVALLAAFHLISAIRFLRHHFLLLRSGSASHSALLWAVGSVLMVLTPVVLIWSLLGGLGGPSYAVYHAGVLVCLLASVGAFIGFLRLDPSHP
jgi:hypothetical protein